MNDDLVFVAMVFLGNALGFVILVGGLALYMNYRDRRDDKR